MMFSLERIKRKVNLKIEKYQASLIQVYRSRQIIYQDSRNTEMSWQNYSNLCYVTMEADRAIIPMYDWLGLGAEAHLNTPGKLGGNWAWRAKTGFDTKALAAQIEAECAVYCRCNADAQNVKQLAI